MPFVYSTLTADNEYVSYTKGASDMPRAEQRVLIKGGAGVATKHLETPLGFVTEVSEDELTFLLKNPVFQLHVKNKFITYDGQKMDIEKVVSDMASRDGSAPMVPQDIPEDGPQVVDPRAPVKVKNRK